MFASLLNLFHLSGEGSFSLLISYDFLLILIVDMINLLKVGIPDAFVEK